MTEKQKELLELLREVDTICREHDLRYVMAGGSMIGVVRNRGFVPWDDDIDLYMPRDDWDKFVEICKSEAPPNRIPIDVKHDRECTNTFPRYGKTEGCVIHRHQLLSKDVAGEIIDVLTLDPIPPDEKSYLSYRENLMLYSELVNPTSVYGPRYEVSPWRFLLLSLKKKLLGKERTYSALEKKMFSWKEEDCDRVAMRWGGCPFLFDKDMFFPTKDMPFEDLMVKVPARVSDYLIWHYGDEWAYVPSHEEREGHDTCNPPLISYTAFRKKYQPRIPVKKILRHSFLRKTFQMFVAKENHRADQARKNLLSKAIVMDTEKRVEELGIPLEELLGQRRFDLLSEAFKAYYATQLSSHFVGREDYLNIEPFYHPTRIPLSDALFFAALWTLLYTERVRWADRMLKIYLAEGKDCQEAQKMMELIRSFRASVNTYEQEGANQAYEALLPLCQAYPENPSFEKFRLKLLYELWQKEALKEEGKDLQGEGSYRALFLSCLESTGRLCPGDGFVEKYEADLLKSQGRIQEAIALYKQAVEDTKNGITWLEVGDILHAIDPEDPPKTPEEKQAKLIAQGYPAFLAPYRLRFSQARKADRPSVFSQEELELLEEKSSLLIPQNGAQEIDERERWEATETCLLLAQVRMAQGRVGDAFTFYIRALYGPEECPARITAENAILGDWLKGEKRLRSYARRTLVGDHLDGWLDKYGSLENLHFIEEVLSGRKKCRKGEDKEC